MPDDPKQAGRPDDQRLNASRDHQMACWARQLGVTPEELRSAIDNAGPVVEDVRQHLNK